MRKPAPSATETDAAATAPESSPEAEGGLKELYASMSNEGIYLANDDLPEVQAKEEFTIGIAMTTVSTDWFKSLADETQAPGRGGRLQGAGLHLRGRRHPADRAA